MQLGLEVGGEVNPPGEHSLFEFSRHLLFRPKELVPIFELLVGVGRGLCSRKVSK